MAWKELIIACVHYNMYSVLLGKKLLSNPLVMGGNMPISCIGYWVVAVHIVCPILKSVCFHFAAGSKALFKAHAVTRHNWHDYSAQR